MSALCRGHSWAGVAYRAWVLQVAHHPPCRRVKRRAVVSSTCLTRQIILQAMVATSADMHELISHTWLARQHRSLGHRLSTVETSQVG